MIANAHRRRLSLFGPLTLALLTLSACGGGGSDGATTTAGAAAISPLLVTTNTDNGAATLLTAVPVDATATTTPATGTASTNNAAAASIEASTVSDVSITASTATTPPVRAVTTTAAASSATSTSGAVANSLVVGVTTPLSASATLAVQGIADAPVPAAAASLPAPLHTYFVDSSIGNDSYDGLTATVSTGGHGPWRSLSRVMRSTLAAGDALRLACNSVWNETLQIPASGTASRPIYIGMPAAGCVTKPVIDGSVSLPAANWTLYQGNIWKAALTVAPLALTSETDTAAVKSTTAAPPPVWTLAHHPNRGYSSANPASLFYSTAGVSSVVTQSNGLVGSGNLITGSDLVLPAGASLVGAGVRTRTNPWWMDESTISAVSGHTLTLGTPTWFQISSGWGYYFVNKLWMVDSDGEWFHDPAAQKLYAYMPAGRVPSGTIRATVLATGIDLNQRDYVTVENLVVRRVGVGADMRSATGSALRNSVIEDTVTFGADVTATHGVTVESNAFTRTGLDTVSGWRHMVGWSMDLVVKNNMIRDSGVIMNGEVQQSLPRMSLAAILGGERSIISGNTILNSGYIGILVRQNSTIQNNFIYGACTVLDDCAGIFTQYADSHAVVRGNTVVHVRGGLAGKAADFAYSQAQGIYLDESAAGVLVENNTVIDAQNGIMLHEASNNIVRDNRLYANRTSQLWMQAQRNNENAAGDVVNNLISNNLIAPVVPGSVGVKLESIYASTALFGTIDSNRYFDRASTRAVMRNTSLGVMDYTFGDWQHSTATDLPAGRDAQGTATSLRGYASYSVSGANMVYNGSFATSTAGWSTWNATPPLGQLVRESCPAGTCVRYVAGGSSGLMSSQNFTVVGGQWYRLSIDIATEQEGQAINLMVRRGGGGNNGYEMLSDRSLSMVGTRAFQRHTIVFQATATVNYRDPATGDLGARIDLQPLEAGKTLRLANVELVPVTLDSTSQVSSTFINAGTSARAWACPFATSAPTMCTKFRRLSDDSLVDWPFNVAAQSADILYTLEPAMRDSDGDGIPDSQDTCPATPANTPVNASGCPLTLH